jgi:hypothetical protein
LLVVVDSQDSTRRYLAVAKGNLAAPDEKTTLAFHIGTTAVDGLVVPVIGWEGVEDLTARDLCAPVIEREDMARGHLDILAVFKPGEHLSPAEVCAHLGVSEDKRAGVRVTLGRLVDKGFLRKDARGCYSMLHVTPVTSVTSVTFDVAEDLAGEDIPF